MNKEPDYDTRRKFAPRDNHSAVDKYNNNWYGFPNYPYIEYEKKSVNENNIKINFNTFLDEEHEIGKFAKHKNKYDKTNDIEIQLGKKNLWLLQDYLNDKCLDKKIYPNTSERSTKDCKIIDYTLPIIGEEIEKVKQTNKAMNKILLNGKKFDSRYIYYASRPICNNENEYPNFACVKKFGQYIFQNIKDHEMIGAPSIKIKNDVDKKCNIYSLSNNQNPYTNYTYSYNEHRYPYQRKNIITHTTTKKSSKPVEIIIDFGKDIELSHISTLGRRQYVYSYPQTHNQFKMMNTRQSFKYIMGDKNEFISKYKVFYRIHKKKEWFCLGSFTGNNDVFTEVINELNITARFIKIVPESFSGSISCQIAFYRVKTKIELKKTDQDEVIYGTTSCKLYLPSSKNYCLKKWSSHNYNYQFKNSTGRRNETRSFMNDMIEDNI